MTNDERRSLLDSVNRALKWPLPRRIRSISADVAERQVSLQFVHDGEIGSLDREVISNIEAIVSERMTHYRIASRFLRVDAPAAYAEKLLPVVIVAMFEQAE